MLIEITLFSVNVAYLRFLCHEIFSTHVLVFYIYFILVRKFFNYAKPYMVKLHEMHPGFVQAEQTEVLGFAGICYLLAFDTDHL